MIYDGRITQQQILTFLDNEAIIDKERAYERMVQELRSRVAILREKWLQLLREQRQLVEQKNNLDSTYEVVVDRLEYLENEYQEDKAYLDNLVMDIFIDETNLRENDELSSEEVEELSSYIQNNKADKRKTENLLSLTKKDIDKTIKEMKNIEKEKKKIDKKIEKLNKRFDEEIKTSRYYTLL